MQQHLNLCFAALKQRVIDAAVAVHAQLAAMSGGGGGGGAGGGGATGQGQSAAQLLRSANAYLQELLQRGLAALLQVLLGGWVWPDTCTEKRACMHARPG